PPRRDRGVAGRRAAQAGADGRRLGAAEAGGEGELAGAGGDAHGGAGGRGVLGVVLGPGGEVGAQRELALRGPGAGHTDDDGRGERLHVRGGEDGGELFAGSVEARGERFQR